MKLACTIFTRDRKQCLLRLLKSLAKQTFIDFRIYIVDDASKESVVSYELEVKEAAGNFEVVTIVNSEPVGICRGRNKIHKLICEEFVMDINDDHELESDCIEKMMQAFENPKIGAVCACTPFVDETVYTTWSRYHKKQLIEVQNIKYTFKGMNKAWVENGHISLTRNVDYIYKKDGKLIDGCFPIGHGSQLIYRKCAFTGSPENYTMFNFSEETDLSFQIRKSGYDIVFCPSAISWHYRSETGGVRSNTNEELKRMQAIDYKIFEDNWMEWLQKQNENK